MGANNSSYFVFHLVTPENPSPKPGPEWPPVEPSPIPPTTDPVPTVPPVTAIHFQYRSFTLN
jgi:hypothetical protein